MKQDNIKDVFDRIQPDASAKERMLGNILNRASKRNGSVIFYNVWKAIPALALAAVLAVGVFALYFKNDAPRADFVSENPPAAGENLTNTDGYTGTTDMGAPVLNQFQIDNRHYILMSDYAEIYGFPATIGDKDIGAKLATIEKSPDNSLIGCEVFGYLPAGSEAVVAVKRNNVYELYRFFTFESYIKNQDEDAIEYLKLYGINGPADIAKIQFMRYTEQSKLDGTSNVVGEITGSDEIAEFYGFYSVLKNASDKYFETLYAIRSGMNANAQPNEVEPDANGADLVPPDRMPNYEGSFVPGGNPGVAEDMPYIENETPVRTDRGNLMDFGGTEPATVAPAQGSNVLSDSVVIRIYNKSGVYFEVPYYKSIGFMSRYEVSNDFAAFMDNYIQ